MRQGLLPSHIDTPGYAFPAEPSIKIGSQALIRVPPVGECSLVHQPPSSVARSVMDARPTPEWIGIGCDADAVVVYFDGETVVRAAHPDSDALRAGVFCRVADRLLRDAVGRDLDRGGEYRKSPTTSKLTVGEPCAVIPALSSACC